MYKEDLPLNNLQQFIYHKTKPSQIQWRPSFQVISWLFLSIKILHTVYALIDLFQTVFKNDFETIYTLPFFKISSYIKFLSVWNNFANYVIWYRNRQVPMSQWLTCWSTTLWYVSLISNCIIISFQTNTLEKYINPLFPASYGLNCFTAAVQKDGFGIK